MDLVESYRQDLRFARKGITKGLLALLIGALLVFPWVATESAVFRLTLVALYAIGVMGQNLLIGYTGQISKQLAALREEVIALREEIRRTTAADAVVVKRDSVKERRA